MAKRTTELAGCCQVARMFCRRAVNVQFKTMGESLVWLLT